MEGQPVKLLTVDADFDGRRAMQTQRAGFDDGGVFDQVYVPGAEWRGSAISAPC